MPVVAQREVPSLSSRRIASLPTKRREPSRTPRSIQPKPSSLGVTRSASLNASRLSCHSTSISASPASIRSVISASSPNGRIPWPCPASSTASSTSTAWSDGTVSSKPRSPV